MNSELVSVAWLREHLDDEGLIILDASKKSNDLSIKGGIPKAIKFNIKDNFTNQNSPFPNTIPTAKQFQDACQDLGINNSSTIVVYDNVGVYTSPRAWWLFKVMGHENVFVLNGGLPEWCLKSYPVKDESGKINKIEPGDFTATLDSNKVKTYEDVLDNVASKSFLLVDVRSEGRFKGTEEEPRKHLKSGSVPNSVNIPYQEVLNKGKFKSDEELKEIFEAECYGSDDLAFSCGSGTSACIVMLASEIAYKKGRYIYDGSWTEWAEMQKLTVENP